MEFLGRSLRHELKYYIHPHEYVTLRDRVKELLTLDENSPDSEGYGIRSLYFDGPHDQALYDKASGVFKRDKYRIRIYNGSDRAIKLERKSKYGNYVCKDAARLSREAYDRILVGDADVLKDSDIRLVRDFYWALKHQGYRPAVIVDYTREAYIYEAGDVRITFDKKLSAGIDTYDLFGKELVLTEVLLPMNTILEVKFNSYLPEPVRMLVHLPAHNRSAISKYLLCREVGFYHFKP